MKRAIFPVLAALVLVLSSLVACSSAPAQKTAEGTRSTAPSFAPGAPGTSGAPVQPPGVQKDALADSGARSGANGATPLLEPIDRMIVYTANMSLFVKDVGQSMGTIADIVAMAGGIVAGTNVQPDPTPKGKEETRTVSMTLRVPATKYQDVMTSLRKLAVKTPDETSSSQDVTEEYSDLTAQLRNLEVVEARYSELMKKANTIDEILKVQQKLNETRSQIERVKGRTIYLERRSDMATISVSLRPEIPAKDTKTGTWDAGKVASEAWEASMVFLQSIATVAIAVAVFSWWLVPLALLIALFWQFWRGRRRPAMTPGA